MCLDFTRVKYTSLDLMLLKLLCARRIQTKQMHFLQICHLLCCFTVACDLFAFRELRQVSYILLESCFTVKKKKKKPYTPSEQRQLWQGKKL